MQSKIRNYYLGCNLVSPPCVPNQNVGLKPLFYPLNGLETGVSCSFSCLELPTFPSISPHQTVIITIPS